MWPAAAWSVELDLRMALFFFTQSVQSCSACFALHCTADLQASRDFARLSQDWTLIAALFMSLKHRLGQPPDLEPSESSL